jgi:hypothetical protein
MLAYERSGYKVTIGFGVAFVKSSTGYTLLHPTPVTPVLSVPEYGTKFNLYYLWKTPLSSLFRTHLPCHGNPIITESLRSVKYIITKIHAT